MRRQNRPRHSSRDLPSGAAASAAKDATKPRGLRRYWISAAAGRHTNVWFRDRRCRYAWIALLSALLFLFCPAILLPFLYGNFIRRYPQWVFRQSTGANSGADDATAIFYHMYIPQNKGKKGIQQALDIITEQLAQVAHSVRGRGSSLDLYYTTTGVAHVAKRRAEQVCLEEGLKCHWMGHWEDGQEDLTLSRLHKFCQISPISTVTYLHTKGSFHTSKGRNHAWRWHLTKAALSCAAKMNSQRMKCNVCGLQFYPVWTTFFPGNMWTARCDYIKRLLPPQDFGGALENVIRSARTGNQFTWSLFNASNPGNLGLGRFSMEHWVGSEPSLQPCEVVSSSPSLEQWYDRNTTHGDSLAHAPQHTWRNEGWFRWNISLVEESRARDEKEFFLLPGFLYKWEGLYNHLPSDDSWVWVWYPDGQQWRRKIH